MTFLELCQRLRREAGISGTAMDTQVVDWVRDAYASVRQIDAVRIMCYRFDNAGGNKQEIKGR